MKTFVFTDIVRSVDLKGHMPGRSDADRDAAFVENVLTPHREHIEQGLADAGGRVVSTAGDGHFLAFDNPIHAAAWAIDVQLRHRDQPILTPEGVAVETRIGLHIGFPQIDPQDSRNFIGKVVDYTARLTDLATGGQLLVSSAALGLIRDASLSGAKFYSHGQHELRGIGQVEVHELIYDGDQQRPLKADKPTPSDELATAPGNPKREWTVLPPTMGLTEFGRQKAGGSSGAAVQTPPAQKIGNYELGELIGAGGMGNVYKARHTQFDRLRAVKIIKPHFVDAGHEEVIRRFYREIKAIGGLDHPNIVVAIDSSSPDDATHFLVMEYVDGVSAEQLINRRNQLAPADACEVIRQAAIGLEYIHRQGMVHRDIKPSNLMLTDVEASAVSSVMGSVTRRPVVKILDLGLALLVTNDDQQRFTRFDHGAMGTAMYMSPEQWITTSVDIRADIYSLGCTLYHLLSGKPPYHDSDLKPQRAHERAPTPSATTDAGAPRELDAILARMMAKAPNDRFNRPAEVAEAIAPFCAGADLLKLIDHARGGPGHATEAGDNRYTLPAETIPPGRPASDTLGPLPPVPGPEPSAVPEPTPLLRRLATPLAIAAAVVFALWMGYQVRQQQARLRAADEKTLVVAAGPAARELANEIDKRFMTLVEASRDPMLRDAMKTLAGMAAPPPAVNGQIPTTKVKKAPTAKEREAWAPLQDWLTKRKADALENQNLSARSWFIIDRYGRQVARRPVKDSIGTWYHYRDYFHGQGELPAEPKPIRTPHQSTVYKSSTSGKLKVSFSVPIFGDDGAEVLGVLAMSLNLGDFQVLEDPEWVPAPLEVALVDLRSDVPNQRGLLLHHQQLEELEDPDNPFRLSDELLSRVDKDGFVQKRLDGRIRKPIIIRDYPDLLNRPNSGSYMGAFEPVVIRGADEKRNNTGWLVIVQEEIKP